MKTIELNDEQHEFLLAMAKAMMTQDNRITENPLYCVYQKKEVPKPEGCGDETAWFSSDAQHTLYEDDIDEFIERYIYEHPEDKDLSREDILEKDGYRKVEFSIEDVPVEGQVYLTEAVAQEHIRCNGYHYTKPFVYVVSAWRNPELQQLMQIVLSLAGERKDIYRLTRG